MMVKILQRWPEESLQNLSHKIGAYFGHLKEYNRRVPRPRKDPMNIHGTMEIMAGLFIAKIVHS